MRNIGIKLTRLAKNQYNLIISNKIFFIFCLFFLFGMLCGGVFVRLSASDYSSSFDGMAQRLLGQPGTGIIYSGLLQPFFSSGIMLLIFFLSGLTAFSILVISFGMFFRGLGYGVIYSVIYLKLGILGLPVCLVMLPNVVISICILGYAGRESVKLSAYLFRAVFPMARPACNNINFKKFAFKYLIYTLSLLIASCLQYFIAKLF